MNAKRNAITKLLESFPQTSGDVLTLLASFEERSVPFTDAAIDLTVARFLDNVVPGQNTRFAPSVPEFITQARWSQDFLDAQARPRIEAPKYHRDPHAPLPFEKLMDKAKASHAHLPVLFEDVTFDQWRRLSAERAIPVGAVWVACLGTVYGPDPKLPVQQYDTAQRAKSQAA